jgi:hypothetical protein
VVIHGTSESLPSVRQWAVEAEELVLNDGSVEIPDATRTLENPDGANV